MKNVVYDYDVVFKDNNNLNENIVFCYGFNFLLKIFKIFEKYWIKSNYYVL